MVNLEDMLHDVYTKMPSEVGTGSKNFLKRLAGGLSAASLLTLVYGGCASTSSVYVPSKSAELTMPSMENTTSYTGPDGREVKIPNLNGKRFGVVQGTTFHTQWAEFEVKQNNGSIAIVTLTGTKAGHLPDSVIVEGKILYDAQYNKFHIDGQYFIRDRILGDKWATLSASKVGIERGSGKYSIELTIPTRARPIYVDLIEK